MTYTVVSVYRTPSGSADMICATINITSYSLGGETITPNILSSSAVRFEYVSASSASGYVCQWNKSSNKLVVTGHTTGGAGSPLAEVSALVPVGTVYLMCFASSF